MSYDNDPGTEAEAMADWDDEEWDDDEEDVRETRRPAITASRSQGGDKPQPDRWRCLATGCNPVLNAATAQEHKDETGHRVAKWPVRSAAGKAKAKQRNRSGYYDKYNVGAKSSGWRKN